MNNLIKDLANLTNEMNRKNITSDIYKETYDDKLAQIRYFLENDDYIKTNPQYVFEFQIGGLSCGRRALNNLLEEHLFEKNIGYEIKNLEAPLPAEANGQKINLTAFCNILFTTINKLDPEYIRLRRGEVFCRDDEYYDVNVIQQILQYLGYENNQITTGAFVEKDNRRGYIINIPGHWYSNVKKGTNYIKYDSNKKVPIVVNRDYINRLVDSENTRVFEVFNKGAFINPIQIIRDGLVIKQRQQRNEIILAEITDRATKAIDSNTNINPDNKVVLKNILKNLSENDYKSKLADLAPKITDKLLTNININSLLNKWDKKITTKLGERSLSKPDTKLRGLLSIYLYLQLNNKNSLSIINKMNDIGFMEKMAILIFNEDPNRKIDEKNLEKLFNLLKNNTLTDEYYDSKKIISTYDFNKIMTKL